MNERTASARPPSDGRARAAETRESGLLALVEGLGDRLADLFEQTRAEPERRVSAGPLRLSLRGPREALACLVPGLAAAPGDLEVDVHVVLLPLSALSADPDFSNALDRVEPGRWRVVSAASTASHRPRAELHVELPSADSSPIVWAFDRPSGRALFAADFARLPGHVRAQPLLKLLHALGRERGLTLLHAASFGCAGRGVLALGHGGAGKSTLALSALDAGLSFVSDDYLFVAHDPHAGRLAHPLFRYAKLHPDNLAARLPRLATRLAPFSGWQGKHVLEVPEVVSLPLGAIIIPRRAPGMVPALEPVAPAAAAAAAGPSTLFQLPGHEREDLASIARIARALPAHLLHYADARDALALVMRLCEGTP